MSIVGFDFGTTNSLISIIVGDQVIRLEDDGQPIPSVICYEGAETIVGKPARNRLEKAGLGVHGNIIRSPKSLLGKDSVFVEGIERDPTDIVSDVVSFVRSISENSGVIQDLVVEHAVVTIPVNMKGKQRAKLRDAFLSAGIRIYQFVHEPLAALYGYIRSRSDMQDLVGQLNGKLILVFDWGGGTLDLTLCRILDGLLVQIVNDGTEEVGGDIFDTSLRDEVERRSRESRGFSDDVDVYEDARTRLLHQCEDAKIKLSTRSTWEIFVDPFYRGTEDSALNVQLPREDMDDIVGNLVNKGVERIQTLLDDNGFSPASISLCLATGGMVSMPKIQARLHELFGPARVDASERNATLISEGAAWIASDKARLHLAKNVELTLARNSYLPLLKAGTAMPVDGNHSETLKFDLYCVDPSDGHGKFELVTPIRPGPHVPKGDKRRSLDVLMVNVDDKAKPFNERLAIEISVDSNLILHAQAMSSNKKDCFNSEIHDLEFALETPTAEGGWLDSNELADASSNGEYAGYEAGDLALRSNIANVVNEQLVPGEVMFRHNKAYFDRAGDPTPIQRQEHEYYIPCSKCSRPANHPSCNCLSKSSTAVR